ncbi:MAG: acyltransferase [Nitrospira sp. LK70]|nr:acyltransferase [Nitrospira sp. LK70]
MVTTVSKKSGAVQTLRERLVAISFKGPGFDQIRILAATVVLLHHCRGIEYADIRIDPLFHYSGGEIHFGFLALAVFFAISGFLVTPSLLRSENVIDFASHRIMRIFPALTVIVIASMALLGPVLTTFSPAVYFSDPYLYRYVKNLTTLTYDFLPGVVNKDGQPIIINGPIWTLHFEVLCYATLALASMFGLLRRRSLFLILLLASYGIHLAMRFDPTLAAVLPDRLLTFIKFFVYFGTGATLFIFADRIPFSMPFAIGAVALIVAALPFGLGAFVMPICLAYFIIFCGLSALPGQALVKKRDLSYGVYLIHAPVLVSLSLLFPKLHTWWVTAMIALPITLLLSYLSWTFVERPTLTQKKTVSNWLNSRIRGWSYSRKKAKRALVADND